MSIIEDETWRAPRRYPLKDGEFDDALIAHFNYADEQDPVGHYLDFAGTATVINLSFRTYEDIVFSRYNVPGVAHNEYWNDQALFNWIVARAVDVPVGGHEPADLVESTSNVDQPAWFDITAYGWLLFWIYGAIPYVVIGLDYFALTLASSADSIHALAIGTVTLVVARILGRRLIDLSVWWRQIQRFTAMEKWDAYLNNAGRTTADARVL
jgi:hypothetical protein